MAGKDGTRETRGMHKTLHTVLAATATLAAVAATVTSTTPALATGTHHSAARGSAFKVVASHLNNPRGIAFGPHGVMYVAEAGKGGTGVCMPDPEGSPVPVCFGFSGS